MSNSVKVKIISIFNPHEFYFKFLDEKSERNNTITRRKVFDIQNLLNNYRSNKVNSQDIKFGEIYGCYIKDWKRCVRGKLVEKLRNGDWKVLLIDHGFFKNAQEIFKINQNLKISFGHIQRGSLPLKSDACCANQWHDDTLSVCNELQSLKDLLEINFIPIYKENEIHVGDLFIVDGLNRYSLSEKLIANSCVRRCSEPKEIFQTLVEKEEVGVFSNCDQPKQKIEIFQKSSSIQSNQLIVYGSNIKPSWKNTDIKFPNFYKQQIIKRFPSMSNAQSCVWPQIYNTNQSVIMIARNNDDLQYLYLVPLLAKILSDPDYKSTASNIGSVAIIFASCIANVEKIARFCKEYASNAKIIIATGICEEKRFELINGCDILITTPSAFGQLNKNISINLLNKTLKYVVYNNFHQLASKFEQHINKILKMFLNLTQRPQFLVTSDSLTNALKCKLINHLQKSETILCVDDNHIEAASFVGMNISIEFISKQDNLYEIFSKSYINHKGKTVIVSSDDEICKNFERQELSERELKFIYCNNADVMKEWSKNAVVNKILVISDKNLERFNVKCAQNLIHYDLPNNWTLFSRRYRVLTNSIIDKLDAKDCSLSSKIFLHDENIEQFVNLMNFVTSQNLSKSKSFSDILERIRISREKTKCDQNVSICSNLLQLGKCQRRSCPSRHILSDQDKPLLRLQPSKSIIKFDLISVQSPTSFIVQIKEHFDTNKWVSRDETNKIIQRHLDEMQAYCQKKENVLEINEGTIGGIYAKFDEKKGLWVRGRMIERVSQQIIKLYLIDFGTITPSLESKLFKLPEKYFKLEPLVCKLQILDLIPLDMESKYDEIHTHKLSEMIKNVDKQSAVYTCKIEFILFDIIFTKSFNSRHNKFNLKSAHQKLKISEIDESMSQNLFELISTIVKKEEEIPAVECMKKFFEIQIKEEVSENSTPLAVNWKMLKNSETYAVNMSHYTSPYSFLIIQENDENLVLKKELKNIEESSVTENLSIFNSGKVCLYRSEKNYRALILSEMDDEIEILLVDYGEIIKCSKENLFKIRPEFVSFNFQVVHCAMMGIRPKYNMKMWPNLQRNAVKKLMEEKDLEIYVIGKDTRANKYREFGINCYEVFLYDRNTKERIDKIAVEQKVADVDKSVDDINLNTTIQNDDILKLNESDSDFVECDGMMHSVHIGKDLENLLGINKKFERNISIDSTKTVASSSQNSFYQSDSGFSSNATATSLLEYIHKPLYIEWRQNEFLIYLLVNAPDCKEYSLVIEEFSLDVIVKNVNGAIETSLIHLFSRINVELCSHQLCGSKIIVKLAKKNFGAWPRLTKNCEKSQYIKFSNENVPKFKFYSTLSSSSSSSNSIDYKKCDSGPAGKYDSSDDSTENESEFKITSSDEDDF
ncbi:hypothetical protein PVAND_004999 [Polypedilum vanderplanki]|uniref:RNA helicase n=1 Tax=Polypedilum vanderplanki TaxID=319348 RepID=A0A9J6C0Q0_POLVA|nr:hypothetical protein PVAND_004999 [Polypedilum vanderplanki]